MRLALAAGCIPPPHFIPPALIRWAAAKRSRLKELVMQPVQKISKMRKRKRRAHHALTPIQYVRCPQCGNAKLPHAACGNCGFVNPGLALAVEEKQS